MIWAWYPSASIRRMMSWIWLSWAPVFMTIIMPFLLRLSPLGGNCHSGKCPLKGDLGPGMIDSFISKLAQPLFSPHLGLFGPGHVDLLRPLRRLHQDDHLVGPDLGVPPVDGQKPLLPPSRIGQLPDLQRRHKRGVAGPDAKIPLLAGGHQLLDLFTDDQSLRCHHLEHKSLTVLLCHDVTVPLCDQITYAPRAFLPSPGPRRGSRPYRRPAPAARPPSPQSAP